MYNILTIIDDLHKQVTVFHIGTIDENGYPNIKTMLPVNKRECVRYIYFSTNTSSQHVAQYKLNPNSCVYFNDVSSYKGVLLKGKMEVLEDTGTKKRFWNVGDEIYYPGGVTDPDYCILKFTAQEGRYYHSLGSEDFYFNNTK